MARYAHEIKKESTLSSFIPYSSHVKDDTVMTTSGDFLRVWTLEGISFQTTDDEVLQKSKEDLNTLWRAIGSEHTALWVHQIRKKVKDKLEGQFANVFCHQLNESYYQSLQGDAMMENRWYLTLLYRPHPSRLGRALLRSARLSVEEIQQNQAASFQAMDEISHRLESSLSVYGVERLTTFVNRRGYLCSRLLSFLNELLTGKKQEVHLSAEPLNTYLGHVSVFAGRELLEIRASDESRFAKLIDFKDYAQHTLPGILNDLMFSPCEYVMTQSFSFLSRRQGQKFLETQQNQLQSVEDGALSQIEEMDKALDDLIGGTFLMGEYHYSLMVYGHTPLEVRKQAADLLAKLESAGFLASTVSLALDAAFFAQLPGNWFYRHRLARITSRNFASLACFHNFAMGKRQGNPWGEAVTLLKSPSRQPVYFNFHASRLAEMSFNQKLLGNASIIGQSSSGKTVLMTFLLSQCQKFNQPNAPLTSVFFDKDQGAEIAIRAMGGRYLALEYGKPTGFNPFHLAPMEENILFLEKLVQKLCTLEGEGLTTRDRLGISHAVRTVMRMPTPYRRLLTVVQNMTESEESRENSLIKRLSRWIEGGSLAWVFDQLDDQLDLNAAAIFGIDGTCFLKQEAIRVPVAMYLLHRLEGIADGRRFILMMDEFWQWLKDDYFENFANDQEKTIRKKNGIFVFASQSPQEILNSRISSSLVEQCATQIFLANPSASYADYVEGFKLSSVEFDCIRQLTPESRLFLIKQGQQSWVAGLDLQGFDEALWVLSGSTDHVAILRRLLAHKKDAPEDWLPAFYQAVKQHRESLRSSCLS